ncbi:BgTH12-07112 [Blumeria graminis f. sp. triticale]|uniref:Bgt-4746 n=3 Tax=Blumeria graminis TaxID=34373 RepID=A0A381L8I7_BLUGR|nr:Carboxylesterase [Blumeria graminis f. sp. tritici 96224]CAD6506182.1 BgTH12-07112 [Blumeria graminis f. sp. triticale]VDB94900.1 Bgt-4746 [Blumeria graminis f. sp. tritici]
MHFTTNFLVITLAFVAVFSQAGRSHKAYRAKWPPTVNIGDGLTHQAIPDVDGGFVQSYRFNGIRYGTPNGRFSLALPTWSSKNKRSKHKERPMSIGSGPGFSKCPQATPNWILDNEAFLRAFIANQSTEGYSFRNGSQNLSLPIQIPEDETEDCLFLDVIVPKRIWDTTKAHPEKGFAPVIVYIHGGGFTSGDKGSHQDMNSLLADSVKVNSQGAILVLINYRLGIFGFLSGDPSIMSNAGLIDQRMALSWIQKNIQKFGGDRFRVTVMGEEAGAASILHHITAPTLSKKILPQVLHRFDHSPQDPFRSAIIQSPAFQPLVESQAIATLNTVLKMARTITGKPVKNVSDLRALSYKTLYTINAAIVYASPLGSYTFGPTIDYSSNSYVPDFPLRRLDSGEFNKGVSILVGHGINEGLFYTSHTSGTIKGFQTHLANMFPTLSERDLIYITNTIYNRPISVDNSHESIAGAAEVMGEIFVDCNVYYLMEKIENSYGYYFKTSPAIQGPLLADIIFGNPTSLNAIGDHVANKFRRKLLQFAMLAEEGAQAATLREYDSSGSVLLVSNAGFEGYIDDPSKTERQCHYWAEASYETGS